MPANIRLGGARVDVSLNAAGYVAGARQVTAQNVRLAGGYTGISRNAGAASATVQQFTTSLRTSIIATVAYAAGVAAVSAVIGGSVRDFIAWDRALIGVQKTTALTDQETALLSDEFERLLVVTSSLGRPLPVLSSNLTEIAEVAGQMRIQGVPDILAFTEAVALLELTSELAGREAANALGLLLTNTDATIDEVEELTSAITALGNEFRGGERDILVIAENIARSTAEFNLSAEAVLAFSAVYSQVGARAEKTGTVFQRSIRALVNAASEAETGAFGKLAAVAQAAGVSIEFLQGLVQDRNFPQALRVLADALANLPDIAGETQATKGSLLTTLFGGEQPPVRIAEILGVLSANVEQIDRAFATTTREFQDAVAALQEAGRAAEADALRLIVVGNQLQAQRRAFGEVLTRVLVPIAENFRVIEALVISIGVNQAAAFGIRRSVRRTQALALEGAQLKANLVTRTQAEVTERALFQQRLLGDTLRAQTDRTLIVLEAERTQLTRARAALETGSRPAIQAGLLNEARVKTQILAIDRQIAVTSTAIATANASRAALPVGFVGRSAERARTVESINKAAAATKVATAANVAFAAQATITARAGRALGAVFAFLGGAPGVIVLGITALVASLFLFRRRADETKDSVGELVDELDALAAARRRASGVDGDVLARAQEEESRLLERQAELTERLATAVQRGASGRGLSASSALRSRIGNELAEVESDLEGLQAALSAATVTPIEEATVQAEILGEALNRLALSLETPGQRVREFVEDLRTANRLAVEASRFQVGIAGEPVSVRQAETAIFERQVELQAELLRLERESGEASRRRLRGEQNINRVLRQQAEEVAAGSPGSQELDQQVATLRDQQIKLVVDQEEAFRALKVAQDVLILTEEQELEILREIVAVRRELIAETLNQRVDIVPDLAGAASDALVFVRDIEEGVFRLQRGAAQSTELAVQSTASARAALEAELGVLNRYEDARRQAERRIVDAAAERQRALAALAAAEVTLRLTAVSEEVDNATAASRVTQLQREVAGLDEAIAIGAEYLRGLDGQKDALDGLATAAGEAAVAHDNIIRSQELFLAATELAQSGVRALEDQVVLLVTEGTFSFRDFADAIIADMARILVRALVTTAALRALGVGPGGDITADSFLGSLLGVQEAHTGGVVGQIERRHRGALGAGERVVVAEVGEEVITQNDPRHRYNLPRWPRFHEGGVVGGERQGARTETRVRVELKNEGNTSLQVTDARARFRGEDLVVSAVLRDQERNGPITQGFTRVIRGGG